MIIDTVVTTNGSISSLLIVDDLNLLAEGVLKSTNNEGLKREAT